MRRCHVRPRHRPSAGAPLQPRDLRTLRAIGGGLRTARRAGERAHSAAQRVVLRLGRCAGPIGAHAAGRADHQSRNRCDPQPRPREQGHQLPREPRECRMSRGCQDQLLRIGQQPCARLGPCRPAGDADDSAETQRESDRRRTQRSRSARTRGAEPCQSAAPDLCEASALEAADQVMAVRRPGDLIVVSIHWGSNWGYHIPDEQKILARALIDKAGVSIVHGHSSHHPRAIEIYRDRLILYGCGDFLNDYEGIRGYERYRDDLALMYPADLQPASGSLQALTLVPLQIKNFRLSYPSRQGLEWVQQTLDRECQRFGTRVTLDSDGQL